MGAAVPLLFTLFFFSLVRYNGLKRKEKERREGKGRNEGRDEEIDGKKWQVGGEREDERAQSG